MITYSCQENASAGKNFQTFSLVFLFHFLDLSLAFTKQYFFLKKINWKMISAEKFKTSLSKTLETLCDNLLPPSVLRSTHHEIFGVKLSRDKAANVRENAITCFKEAVEDEFKKMCDEMEVRLESGFQKAHKK